MPIIFGCDIGHLSDRNLGIMDSEPFNYRIAINATMLRMNETEIMMA